MSVEGWPERALEDITRLPWTLLVLLDVPTGAMKQLPGFLEEATRRGVEIAHDLPGDQLPIRRGAVAGELDHLVRGGWPPATAREGVGRRATS